jgi:hypothetical protein
MQVVSHPVFQHSPVPTHSRINEHESGNNARPTSLIREISQLVKWSIRYISKWELFPAAIRLKRRKCLARIFHELPAATVYLTVLPGVLGCSFDYAQDKLPLRRTVQVRLGSNSLRLPGITSISTVSRQKFMKYPG